MSFHDQFPESTRTPEALAKSKPKETAMAELRRILHAEDECHPGLTCADEIMKQQDEMLGILHRLSATTPSLNTGMVHVSDAFITEVRAIIAKAEGRK